MSPEDLDFMYRVLLKYSNAAWQETQNDMDTGKRQAFRALGQALDNAILEAIRTKAKAK